MEPSQRRQSVSMFSSVEWHHIVLCLLTYATSSVPPLVALSFSMFSNRSGELPPSARACLKCLNDDGDRYGGELSRDCHRRMPREPSSLRVAAGAQAMFGPPSVGAAAIQGAPAWQNHNVKRRSDFSA